jgi:transcriptional regulator with XRE-family HTH domain
MKVAPQGPKWTPPPHTLWGMSDERQPRPAAQYGPTAATVAANVQRLRKRRELSIYQLSKLLRDRGRPITPAAVGKIERQQRQVTVDDLVTLAVVFGVSPSALLLPLDDTPNRTVEITGAGDHPVRADVAWDWMDGKRPLRLTRGNEETELLEYDLYSRPQRRRLHETPIRETTEEERAQVRRALGVPESSEGGTDGPSMD